MIEVFNKLVNIKMQIYTHGKQINSYQNTGKTLIKK